MSVLRAAMQSPLIRRTLVALTTIALLLSLLRLVPPLRERIQLQTHLRTTIDKRSTQETLYPLFAELSTLAQADTRSTLMRPETEPLQNEAVASVATSFEKMAAAHGFTLSEIRVRVTPSPPQRLLSVTLPLQGNYAQFGSLLYELLRFAPLQSLDRITVQFGEATDQFHIECKLALE